MSASTILPAPSRTYSLAEIEADAVPVIAEVRAAYPVLSWSGYGMQQPLDHDIKVGTSAYYLAQIERLRDERAVMTDDRHVGQFLRAARYINAVPKTKHLNRNHSCYGWKHRAERFHKMRDDRSDYYVGEGMFIAAAITMGLIVRVSAHAVMVNLGQAAWDMAADMPDAPSRRRGRPRA